MWGSKAWCYHMTKWFSVWCVILMILYLRSEGVRYIGPCDSIRQNRYRFSKGEISKAPKGRPKGEFSYQLLKSLNKFSTFIACFYQLFNSFSFHFVSIHFIFSFSFFFVFHHFFLIFVFFAVLFCFSYLRNIVYC